MLSQIVTKKKTRIAAAKLKTPLDEIREKATHALPPRPFLEALSSPGVAIIAEIKKASPSKGNFNLQYPIEELAQRYEAGGARAISVLTEEDYFKGSPTDLSRVRNAVKLPLLRKDFIIDSYQLYESRAIGADAVLLITGLLEEKELTAFIGLCSGLGLAALVETHSEFEIKSALRAGAQIIGINNRNLKTFQTDLCHTIDMAPYIPKGIALVSESGIHGADDVSLLAAAGATAVLVGEALVNHHNPAQKIAELAEGALS